MDSVDDGFIDDLPRIHAVGKLVVDLDQGTVLFPGGQVGRYHPEVDAGVVEEAAFVAEPLWALSDAFGVLAEDGGPEFWCLSTEDDPHNSYRPALRRRLSLRAWGPGELSVTAELAELWEDEDETFEKQIPALLAPLLDRAGTEFYGRPRNAEGPTEGELSVTLTLPEKGGATGADLLHLGLDAQALLVAARHGPLSPQAALDLVLAGRAGALVGIMEGEWLDAKSAPYRTVDAAQSFELAKDVSAFANAAGGLIIVPATTRVDTNGEILDEVRELDLDLVDVKQIRDILADWIHPLIEGLIVRLVETAPGRGQLVIYVPPQRQELWPHIIVRGPVGDRIRSTVITVCVRDGPDVRTLGGPAIHSMLSRGHQSGLPTWSGDE